MAFSYVVARVLDNYPHLNPRQVESRLAYASFASVDDRFVYLEVPKAACTTMKILLRELYGSAPLKLFGPLRREADRSMFVHARENVPLPPLTALGEKDQRDLLEAPDVLRFTVVRNPYARLVSAWRSKVFLCDPSVEDVYAAVRGAAPPVGRKQPIGFAEFVAYIESRVGETWDAHWQRQVDLIFPKAFSFTHVGRAEDFGATSGILSRHLNRQAITAPRANETFVRPAARYSEELARRVYGLYEEDFTTFGYDSDSWPRGQENYPPVMNGEGLIDEIIERNVIIAQLYNERERLRKECHATYRFSLAWARNKLRRLAGSVGWT
jgi:hypothetical protein